MAIYLGKEQPQNSLRLAKRQEDIKGIEGEIKVGDLLDQYLPDDTYLIAQPEIGNYQPDFLVISPRYGFRIIEVKNHSLKGNSNIQSNGNFTTRYGSRNYLNQARAHVDDLKSYLLSNHPYLGDTHKMIGYCVLNIGFTRGDFERKFEIQIKSWDEAHTQDFFKYHLFIDQLSGHVDSVLAQTTKFPNSRLTSLTTPRIKEIASNLKIGEVKIQRDSETEIDSTPNDGTKGKHRKWWLVGVLFILLALPITYFALLSSDSISLSNVENHIGTSISIEAKVTSFYYDEKSKTKLLTIQNDTGSIDSVIFDDVKVPYINEGETYEFVGVVQEYNGEVQLQVKSVEQVLN